MARITINTLVSQVKKVIANKAGNEYIEKAYINSNGDIIAANYCQDAGEVKAFIAGVFADIATQDLNKLYSKDALSIYAKTGVLAGGVELPEAYKGYFELPEDNFTELTTVPADVMKDVLTAVSKDNTRHYLTGFNINMSLSYIESCDGFRAYRCPISVKNKLAQDVIIPGFGGNVGFKGDVIIAAGEKYARLTDTATGLNVYTRIIHGPFVNLDAIYTKAGRYITVNDLETLTPFLKTACKLERDARMIYIRVKDNKFDYSIPGLDIVGSLETDNREDINAIAAYNPAYLLDAITTGGNTLLIDEKHLHVGPLTVGAAGGPEALLLPIREDRYTVNDAFKKLDIKAPQPAETTTEENKPETPAETDNSPAPVNDLETTETTETAPQPQEGRAASEDNITATEDTATHENGPAEDSKETTTAQAPAPVRRDFFTVPAALTSHLTVSEREAIEALNRQQNEDNRFVNISSEDVKRQQAITAAQAYYKALHGYKVSTIQAITAEAIYQANRDILQPIARRAGGLYIDNTAIIAAITAAADLYELQEV